MFGKKRRRDYSSILYVEYVIKKVGATVFMVLCVVTFFYLYFTKFQPAKRTFARKCSAAWNIIQTKTFSLYRKQGYLFDGKFRLGRNFCEELALDIADEKQAIDCRPDPSDKPVRNFTLKGTKTDILGLEKPFMVQEGIIFKDIVIDVNGAYQGKNSIGEDRMLLRVYSNGFMAGKLSPVNCKLSDEKDYGIKKSPYCADSPEVDYLEEKFPFAFDVTQTGADLGRTRHLRSGISFARADCVASMGELLYLDEYCSQKGIYQLKTCFDDVPCNVSLSKYFNVEKKW